MKRGKLTKAGNPHAGSGQGTQLKRPPQGYESGKIGTKRKKKV